MTWWLALAPLVLFLGIIATHYALEEICSYLAHGCSMKAWDRYLRDNNGMTTWWDIAEGVLGLGGILAAFLAVGLMMWFMPY